jgi:hypothetical protein
MDAKRRRGIRRGADAALIALGLALLALPLADNVLGLDPFKAWTENRTPAPFPELRLDSASLRSLSARLKAYYDDHFGFRGSMLRLHALAKTRLLGLSPSRRVVLGKDGWLFYADEGSIESHRRARPFEHDELERWRLALEGRRGRLAARGIRYLLVIAPDKHTIYPEFMPDRLVPVRAVSRLDQLVEHLRRASDMEIVDPRALLIEAKARERVYHCTDSHWNDRGSFLVAEEVIRRLGLPGVALCGKDAYARATTVRPGQDLACMVGLPDLMGEVSLDLVPAAPRAPRPERPRAILLGDSFAPRLEPFLGDHLRIESALWQTAIEPSLGPSEGPAAVIEVIAERKLTSPENIPTADIFRVAAAR